MSGAVTMERIEWDDGKRHALDIRISKEERYAFYGGVWMDDEHRVVELADALEAYIAEHGLRRKPGEKEE